MESDANHPAAGITRQSRRRGSSIDWFGLAPPMVRIHTDRSLDANVRKVCEIADQDGAVTAVAYGRNGLRILKKIRHRLPDGYTTFLLGNDPEEDPDRWQRQQHKMSVNRVGGPDPNRPFRPARLPSNLGPQP